MIKTVKWTSTDKFPCAADIIICLKDSVEVAQKACVLEGEAPEITEETDFPYHTIEGEITSRTTVSTSCEVKTYEYNLKYDDGQLGGGGIAKTDIEGIILDDCYAAYSRELAGNDVYVEERDPGVFTLVSQHGCEYELDLIKAAERFVFEDFEGEITAEAPLTIVSSTVTTMRVFRLGTLRIVAYNVQVELGGADGEFIYLPLPDPGTLVPNRHDLQADDNGSIIQDTHVSYPGPTESQIGVRQEDVTLWPDGATYNIYGYLIYEAATA